MICELTLRSDRLRDWAGVTEAIGIDCTDNKQVNCVGEESDDGVFLLLYMVCYSLPGAAH